MPVDPRIEGASAPPNETVPLEEGLAGEEHAHDGWNGAERITVADVFVEYLHPFRLVEGLVLEGTGEVEVLLDKPQRRVCPNANILGVRPCGPAIDALAPPSGVHLWFRHAATREWQDAGAIDWGTPIVIAIADPTWIDMPHSGLSLWEFQARSPNAEDALLVFHARVDIVRGVGEIPRWPGHPRFYVDAHEREVLRGSGRTEEPGVTSLFVDPGWVDASAVPAQKLISWGTATLVVLVNVTATEAPPGVTPTAWQLGVSNATGSWAWQARLPAEGPLRWVVPVETDGMDSPYSDASRWRFLVTGDLAFRAPEGSSFSMGGFTPYSADYDIVVVASDLPPEEYAGPTASPG